MPTVVWTEARSSRRVSRGDHHRRSGPPPPVEIDGGPESRGDDGRRCSGWSVAGPAVSVEEEDQRARGAGRRVAWREIFVKAHREGGRAEGPLRQVPGRIPTGKRRDEQA